MNYYIADMHLGHKNVIKHDGRPFKDIDEMNYILMKNWNNKVGKDDDVWILGDFVYRSDKDPSWFLKQLKGHKHLIIGNHDNAIMKSTSAHNYLESIENMYYFKDGEDRIFLCHYPIAEWSGMKRGSYHIYGHIHVSREETYEYMKKKERAFNAGCMINNYEPVSLDELKENNLRFQKEELN